MMYGSITAELASGLLEIRIHKFENVPRFINWTFLLCNDRIKLVSCL